MTSHRRKVVRRVPFREENHSKNALRRYGGNWDAEIVLRETRAQTTKVGDSGSPTQEPSSRTPFFHTQARGHGLAMFLAPQPQKVSPQARSPHWSPTRGCSEGANDRRNLCWPQGEGLSPLRSCPAFRLQFQP